MVNEPSLFSHTRNCIYEMNAFHKAMFPCTKMTIMLNLKLSKTSSSVKL